MNKLKDKRILSLLRKSPEEGLSLALDTYGGAVKTICKNILFDCSNEDIEEAISDTFLKLWKNVDKFKKEKGTNLKVIFTLLQEIHLFIRVDNLRIII